MLDTMRRAQYFKVQVPNKPGEAARCLGVLEAAHVNLLAFLAFPRNRRWQMDFVPEDPSAFKATVTRARFNGWKIQGPKTCFLVEGEDRVGAMAMCAHRLAIAKVNIHAVAAVVGGAGRHGVILWVKPKDVRRAAKALGIPIP